MLNFFCETNIDLIESFDTSFDYKKALNGDKNIINEQAGRLKKETSVTRRSVQSSVCHG